MWFKVKQETVEKVSEIVKKQLSLAEDQKVTARTKFTELGADSLDTVSTKPNCSILLSYVITHCSIMNKLLSLGVAGGDSNGFGGRVRDNNGGRKSKGDCNSPTRC